MEKRITSDIIKNARKIAAGCICILTAVFVVIYGDYRKQVDMEQREMQNGEILVALNEISQLEKQHSKETNQKIQQLTQYVEKNQQVQKAGADRYLFLVFLCSLGVLLLVFGVLYVLVLRPFVKLERFAENIASGDLEKPFDYERVNMFGQFTWAFDHMRTEIIKAKKAEQAAVENNKTVIASLSHDIKTPIASIRGYAEGLAMHMDSTKERRERYIKVILKKCDEVTKITNDMFLHSLHDLERLVIQKNSCDIQQLLQESCTDMQGATEDIIVEGSILPAILQNVDENRIMQCIENIISNARKYAKESPIYVTTAYRKIEEQEYYEISFQDQGGGIADADMPFIFDKFYRGKNVEKEPGAGLGLFIVKYLMEQMKGEVSVENKEGGVCVHLYFSIHCDKL